MIGGRFRHLEHTFGLASGAFSLLFGIDMIWSIGRSAGIF
jgi:hypothetical protein